MTDTSKRLITPVFAVVPLVLLVMMGLGLATGSNSRTGSPSSYAPLVPMQSMAPATQAPVLTTPMLVPRNDPLMVVNQTFPQVAQRLFPTPTPAAALPVRVVAAYNPPSLPLIGVLQAIPQGIEDLLPPLAAAWPSQTTAPRTAPGPAKLLPFQEAHWQGIEAVPLTDGLRRLLNILPDAKGVIIDDVTMPADLQGFMAGDLITAVGQVPTPDLESFLRAADRVRDRRRAEIQFLRKNKTHTLILTALQKRLGTANGETAPMIKPGARAPHAYKGACTNCHNIGTTGQLAMDNGDLLTRTALPIRAGQTPPHRDRGACTACHTIVP